MVRFRSNRYKVDGVEGVRLNSTMVRFRSLANLEDWKELKTVSIPLWFDLDIMDFSRRSLIAMVSIPLWFDLDECAFGQHQPFQAVSIPLWFDLDHLQSKNRFDASERSQFHYGSI